MRHPSLRCGAVLAVLVFGSALALSLTRCAGPSGSRRTLRPPAWDESAFAAFARRGIAPPRTVFTRETPGELDLAWAREAIADARRAEPSRFERQPERWGRGAVTLGVEGRSEEGEEEEIGEAESVEIQGPPGTSPGPELTLRAPREPQSSWFFGVELPSRDEEGGPRGEPPAVESQAPKVLDARVMEPPRIGKILYQDASGKYESLVPRALRVQAVIEGPRARTVVDYVFSNPHSRRLEGTFYYPLPAGASPAAFGMFRAAERVPEEDFRKGKLLPPVAAEPRGLLTEDATLEVLAPARVPDSEAASGAYLVKDWGELQRARVVEQRRATEVYEAVVRRQIDPALLEWSGGNTFQARVFPIEPNALKRVVLVYEQTLPVDGEMLRYVYPLPGERELGEIAFSLWTADAHGTLRAVAGRETPPEPSARLSGWSRYELAFQAGQSAAVDLAIRPPNSALQVLEASECRGLPGSVFFARLRPPFESRPASSPTGRALFVVDTSLSREGPGHGYSVELLERILERDSTIQEYAVLLFDIRARWLHAPGWRANDEGRRTETIEELGRVYLEGATNFDAVLSELEGQASWIFEPGRPVSAFLLSDGFLTWGQERAEVLLNRHLSAARARWIAYAFGSAPCNQDLFDALSRASGGRTVTILTREEIASGALAHRTAPAALKSVFVEGARARDLVVAGDPRLLFSGQELQIAGRIEPSSSNAELVVEAELDGQTLSWRAPLRASGDSALAPRAWAELYSKKLLALEDERLHRMVVALSQKFHLANRAASFLILDREEEYKAFDLAEETVDLAELETLRIQEEDQRLDRIQGIALDGASDLARAVVSKLAEISRGRKPPLPPLPLADRPLAGGEERMQAEISYRKTRSERDLDAKTYDAVARARVLAGDTLGALRAYSSLVEKHPASAEAARFAGYACMALGQYAPARELFERVRLRRPFEPQAYLEEALALSADGDWGSAARNYEIVLSREFPRHDSEAKVTAAYHYARLLKAALREESLPEETRAELARRLEEISSHVSQAGFEPIDLQVTIHWNTDSTDIDLWVVEPEGERCYYSHPETAAGGRLYWDVTDGYGPELYQRRKASGGTFGLYVHYYGNRSARLAVPTAVLLVRDRNIFAPEDEFTRRYQMRLLEEEDALLELGREEF